MKLEYNGQEIIPASKETVWSFVSDPAKVGNCLPDVQKVTVKDARNLEAVVKVGVGPVRGNFKFKIALEPDDATQRMGVSISGGGLGSVVDLKAGATLSEADGTTTLDWHGEATMRGPVAAVGGRVLDAQAQKLITQTFANVKDRVGAEVSA